MIPSLLGQFLHQLSGWDWGMMAYIPLITVLLYFTSVDIQLYHLKLKFWIILICIYRHKRSLYFWNLKGNSGWKGSQPFRVSKMVGEGFDPFSAEPPTKNPHKESMRGRSGTADCRAGRRRWPNWNQHGPRFGKWLTNIWLGYNRYNYNWPWAMGSTMVSSHLGFLGCTSKSWGSTREHYPKSETICRFQSSKSDKDPERQWYYWDGLRPAIYDGCSHALFKSKRLHFVVDRRGKLLQTL